MSLTLTPRTLTPLSKIDPTQQTQLAQIKLVATDMDGTLTIDEKFTPELLQAFDRLTQAGIAIVIVTGRSAGWVSAIAHYLPIYGAICENGGLFYSGELGELVEYLVPIADITQHRQRLAMMFQQLQTSFPAIQPASDNAFRLTDWTFDVTGLSQLDLAKMAQECESAGWGFTYSTVQCHIKLPTQEKAIGLHQVLKTHFPIITPAQVVTVGDSPNDVTLFDRANFPNSVGVANLQPYLDQIAHHPQFITALPGGKGFGELVDCLV
jgi:HAD superfamily hydrolase (TIGR01484 family)